MKIGDELMMKWIYGHFVLRDSTNPKIFIGTWVGISPLIAMAKHCEHKEKKIFFSVPTAQDIFYLDTIKSIPYLDYEIHVTREKVEGTQFGRIDIDKADIPLHSDIYVCGRRDIVKNIVQQLANKWYKNIYSEIF